MKRKVSLECNAVTGLTWREETHLAVAVLDWAAAGCAQAGWAAPVGWADWADWGAETVDTMSAAPAAPRQWVPG
jgi:hypothetical protein